MKENLEIFCNGCMNIKPEGMGVEGSSCKLLTPEMQLKSLQNQSCDNAVVKGFGGEMTIEGFVPSKGC